MYELLLREPREAGSEEYRDSEKYEVHHWDLDAPGSLRHFIARVNAIRRAHPALQSNESLRFHHVENDQLVCWSKRSDDGADVVLSVVNLDPWYVQSAFVNLDSRRARHRPRREIVAHDLLTNAAYEWSGSRNFVQLDPGSVPAHIFSIVVERAAPVSPR